MRDVAAVAQRLEMVRRIASEIEGYVVELGADGRLLVAAARRADRRRRGRSRAGHPRLPAAGARSATSHRRAGAARARPARRPPTCSTCPRWRRPWAHDRYREALDDPVSPRGYRLLARGPATAQRSSSTDSSTTSAACRSCWPPASTTCRWSTASVRAGPGPSARDCPGWPSRASSSATSDVMTGVLAAGRALHEPLLSWYAEHARTLPWRSDERTPWAVMVSEFMLQQTSVDRVLPVFDTWIEAVADARRARCGDPRRGGAGLGAPGLPAPSAAVARECLRLRGST